MTLITKEILENISILDFKAYLLANGWLNIDKIADKALIFCSANNEREIILPLSKSLGDFTLRMSETMHTLSLMEQRYELDIIKDIQKSGVDTIRIRMLDDTQKGTISLSKIYDIFTNTKEMLLSSACAVIEPKKVYGSRKCQEATDYLNKVQIGQTEYGSYVFTFLSPVAPKLEHKQQALLFGDDLIQEDDSPFERKVTNMLSNALNETRKSALSALSEGTIDYFEKSIDFGVSANLCDAVFNIIDKVGKTEISFKWSKNRPRKDNSIQSAINFDRDMASVIHQASQLFKKSAPQNDITVTGWAHNLNKNQQGSDKGTITIETLIDGKLKKIKTELSDSDYQKVIQSHADNKYISLEGDVYIEGRKTTLKNPRNIKIIESEDND